LARLILNAYGHGKGSSRWQKPREAGRLIEGSSCDLLVRGRNARDSGSFIHSAEEPKDRHSQLSKPEVQRRQGTGKSQQDLPDPPTNRIKSKAVKIARELVGSLDLPGFLLFGLVCTLASCSRLQMNTEDDKKKKKLESASLCSHNYRAQDDHNQIRTESLH
jgi:hypothetical protein